MSTIANGSSDSLIKKAQIFVNDFNEEYARKHEAFENQYWGTKMALRSTEETPYSTDLLSRTKKEMEDLLSDANVSSKAKDFLVELEGVETGGDDKERVVEVLNAIVRTSACYDYPTVEARETRSRTNKLEDKLSHERNGMNLGYTRTDGSFVAASSVALRTVMRTSSDESERRSAYEGLRSVGDFVCDKGFAEIVKLRNRLSKSLGYEDYYDHTVRNAEGFSKQRLFEILDGLEEGTRPLMLRAREELERRHGASALLPWNTGHAMAGSIVRKMNPYFPFGKAVERYARSYAAMRISYQKSVTTLDLLDRPRKYSNGFCHWPRCAWVRPDGTREPAKTNFTSLADPTAVGSGLTALKTLMHEAGHAAHFANVARSSPLFSQERAPTSVAYAENQSMFLDSLVGDPAWRVRYARNEKGEPLPFSVVEEEIRATHPFEVFSLRAMLAVSYFEKALYELPEEEVTPDTIRRIADNVETRIQGGPSPRPLLSVPHLISDESSCYYQGYTLAEMSVHQTRRYFLERDGFIVDNPEVGPTLTKAYWECGNSRPFLEIVKELTGEPLSGKAWVDKLKEGLEDRVKRERREYDEAVERCRRTEEEGKEKDDDDSEIDLQMTVRFVDGDEIIADSDDLGLLGACREFERFVAKRVTAAAAAET